MSGDSAPGDYREVNRRGWAELVRHGCQYTRPVDAAGLAQARTWLAPDGWLDWTGIGSVLCLASGGGQQGPLFASLGKRTTVVDLSAEQLDQDRRAAVEHGLTVETIELDMQDLSPLHGRGFDLVYQPVSAGYVPDVRRVYREVARVLKPGGAYLIQHWNPALVQMPETGDWDGEGYRLVHPQTSGRPIPQTTWRIAGQDHAITTWHYIHPLADLIGGLLDEGFTLLRFTEPMMHDAAAAPGSLEHVAAYAPPMFRMLARRQG